MHHALLLVVAALARAHDIWLLRVGRRIARLEAEGALFRARILRLPGRPRPHYRRKERRGILWRAARHGRSVETTAQVFVVTEQTILNWHRVTRRKDPHLLPPLRGLPDLVHDLVHRLKAEWPRWGTRRSAAQLARLGVNASRSSVQRILRRGPIRPANRSSSPLPVAASCSPGAPITSG